LRESHILESGHARQTLIILPDRDEFNGVKIFVAVINMMGYVSRMEISTVIGNGNSFCIEILQQLKISFPPIFAFS
jgi:hypothetical protein